MVVVGGGGSCKWMSEATPPLFGNRAVHRMDGDYRGEPGRVSKRARPGGHRWREMTAIVCRIITVCLLLFFPCSDGGPRQRQSQRFAAVASWRRWGWWWRAVAGVWYCP